MSITSLLPNAGTLDELIDFIPPVYFCKDPTSELVKIYYKDGNMTFALVEPSQTLSVDKDTVLKKVEELNKSIPSELDAIWNMTRKNFMIAYFPDDEYIDINAMCFAPIYGFKYPSAVMGSLIKDKESYTTKFFSVYTWSTIYKVILYYTETYGIYHKVGVQDANGVLLRCPNITDDAVDIIFKIVMRQYGISNPVISEMEVLKKKKYTLLHALAQSQIGPYVIQNLLIKRQHFLAKLVKDNSKTYTRTTLTDLIGVKSFSNFQKITPVDIDIDDFESCIWAEINREKLVLSYKRDSDITDEMKEDILEMIQIPACLVEFIVEQGD